METRSSQKRRRSLEANLFEDDSSICVVSADGDLIEVSADLVKRSLLLAACFDLNETKEIVDSRKSGGPAAGGNDSGFDEGALPCGDAGDAPTTRSHSSCHQLAERGNAYSVEDVHASTQVLCKVFEWCQRHVQDPVPTRPPQPIPVTGSPWMHASAKDPFGLHKYGTSIICNVLTEWDRQFFTDLTTEERFSMMAMAHSLQIFDLEECLHQDLAERIRGKTEEEIRGILGVVPSFSELEWHQIRTDANWLKGIEPEQAKQ